MTGDAPKFAPGQLVQVSWPGVGEGDIGTVSEHLPVTGQYRVNLLDLRFVHSPEGVYPEVLGSAESVVLVEDAVQVLSHVPGCAGCAPAGDRSLCVERLADALFSWRASLIGGAPTAPARAENSAAQGVAVQAERPAGSESLLDWWVDLAKSEVGPLIEKATEYGGAGRALDLIDVGRDMLRMQGIPDGEITDEWATEAGIYFYLRGKFSRWMAAMLEKRRVSDDTLHDIGVYVRMAQRAREVGGWPV